MARIWLGSAREPDRAQAVIAPSNAQMLEHASRDSHLTLTWRNLKDTNAEETGVELRQVCTLEPGSEFLRVRIHLVNRGEYSITGLFLGVSGIALDNDSSLETLTAPSGGMGSRFNNPRATLKEKAKIFSIPPTAPGSLVCGWMDLSTPQLGFGTGYLNRRGIDMIGEVRFEPGGATLGWRIFRYQGAWAFMEKINGPLQVYPLRPGEEFTTDDWFLGFHHGDWHETAAHYRKEYERVFAGDYLTWEKTSPAVRNADLIINTTAAWGVMAPAQKKYDLSKGEVRNKFLEFPVLVGKVIDAAGVEPRNTLVVMLGQATHWGIYKLPDYFPVNAEAGGPEAFKEMIRQLRREIGVAGTHFYAHAAFNHPQADHYVSEADTGWDANLYSNFDHLGRIACMDDEAWWQLWKNKIIPGFVAAGASGIEFDEGFGHHFICSKPEHRHGTSSVSVLTAQPRGALRIFHECRKAFGPEGYLESEGGSDVGARLFDLWEAGGKRPVEIVRYTHPDKLMALFANDVDDINRAFIYGLVVLRSVHGFTPEIAGAVRRYAQLRRVMRARQAPGYPHGFRDDRGLTLSDPKLIAKAYSGERGITVAYYAKEATYAELSVDGRPLGHPKIKGRHRVQLEIQQPGYVVFA